MSKENMASTGSTVLPGNQGPYVLKGNQGESYIFVIPESEKVFVNGKLLKKGSDKEYSIQYETAPNFVLTLLFL